jgi:ABC-2 family transporter protein
MNATQHKVFSPSRVAAIASNTLLELIRLKVFYFLLLFALVVMGCSLFLVRLSFQEQFQVLKDVSFGAMSIFSWLLAVLATAMLLPKDIEDRTLYTILAKPVPRFEYLLGKLLGVFMLIFIALSFMAGMFVIVLYIREQGAIADAVRENPPELLAAAIAQIKASTFDANIVPAIVIVYLKAALCAALTLLLSTFASSSIFTIIVSVVVYIIGHVQPIAREYWLATNPAGGATKVFLALVSLIIPDLKAFDLLSDLGAGMVIPTSLFLETAGLGGFYILVYFFVGYLIFAGKEL